MVDAEQRRNDRRRHGYEESQADGLQALVVLALERGYKAGWAAGRQAFRNGERRGGSAFFRLLNEERAIRRGLK